LDRWIVGSLDRWIVGSLDRWDLAVEGYACSWLSQWMSVA
jgi:hypothetical protein